MKTKSIPSRWLSETGRRLDPGPYLSGSIEAKELLKRLPIKNQPLRDLTKGHDGGIYNGPQFSRNYVDSAEHGVPFLGSGSMLLADLSNLPFLRRRDAESAKFVTVPGDLSYQDAIAAFCALIGKNPVYKNPGAAWWGYPFLPAGKTVTFNDANKFL